MCRWFDVTFSYLSGFLDHTSDEPFPINLLLFTLHSHQLLLTFAIHILGIFPHQQVGRVRLKPRARSHGAVRFASLDLDYDFLAKLLSSDTTQL